MAARKGIATAANAPTVKLTSIVNFTRMEGTRGCNGEVNCETDFVARSSKIRELVTKLRCRSPRRASLSQSEGPRRSIAHELNARARANEEGKPDNILEKSCRSSRKILRMKPPPRQNYIRDDR